MLYNVLLWNTRWKPRQTINPNYLRWDNTLLEKFWRILLYVIDDAMAKLNIWDVKFRQIEWNWRKFCHIELSVIRKIVKQCRKLQMLKNNIQLDSFYNKNETKCVSRSWMDLFFMNIMLFCSKDPPKYKIQYASTFAKFAIWY